MGCIMGCCVADCAVVVGLLGVAVGDGVGVDFFV